MIEKLVLTNFRRHEDLEISFGKGLQVIRAANEIGKTTLFESIAYALFGSKSLRTTLAQTVTWGRPESSLRAELTLNIEGRKLLFSRGKSGGEVIEDGRVIVTGQNEVSLYAANLLGCDGTAAANLMIASQNSMRGSLEQGPKATTEMLEKLADFNLFDTLIERIQSNLIVGAPATFEARVADAQARLDAFVPAPKPDEVGHTAWLAINSTQIDTNQHKIDDGLQPAYRAAEKVRDDVVHLTKVAEEADEELRRAEQTLADHTAQHDRLTASIVEFSFEPSMLEEAKHKLADLTAAAGASDAYAVFKALPTCEHEFDEPAEAFAAWLDSRRTDLQVLKESRAAALSRIAVLTAGIVSTSVCGFCGQDVSAFPDVATKNAETESMISALKDTITEYTTHIPEIEAEITAGKAIETAARQVQQALPKLNGLVNVDTGFTPSRVTWKGEAPTAVDLAPARAAVANLERRVEQVREARAKVSVLVQVLVDDAAAVVRARAKVTHCQKPADAATLYQAYVDAQQALWGAEADLQVLKTALSAKRDEYNNTVAVFNARQGEHERLSGAVAQATKDLGDLAFNNTLLKKVRAARPIIADKLWNTVLAAVSTMFSQMRGEPSAVTKDGGGFKVNGQPIEALSGSTLDILGLAIRTALVKTFIPHAAFMLLDEAAAACDEDRTGSLLGFVAGSGFEQVVLVTHESASEAVADNVIQL